MANEKRLIDAKALLESLWQIPGGRPQSVVNLICATPTVDAVEVVRCKDCKYFVFDCGVHYCDFHTTNAADYGEGYCDGACYVHSADYCSYGERREGE